MQSNNKNMPDVSLETKSPMAKPLQWVGMEKIDLPLFLPLGNKSIQLLATANAYVSLDEPLAKGIHMSRLYLNLYEQGSEKELTPKNIKAVLKLFKESQAGLSQNSKLEIAFLLPLKRKALVSDKQGWKTYPCKITSQLVNEKVEFELDVQVTYSSTCPCSAALARQLVQDQFVNQFKQSDTVNVSEVVKWLGKESSIVATPHAQRSFASLKVKYSDSLGEWSFIELINQIEAVLKTPVQTAVKREDEQEFARLNGSNLMFCEDSARKVSKALDADTSILDYKLHIEHAESLHAHNAVSVNVKGVEGGYF
jgi:GTP cyclohydrolase I